MDCFDPKISREIEVSSKKYIVNDKYYLVDFSSWDEDLRDWLAEREGISLNHQHLHIINHLRQMFELDKRHPVIRTATSELTHRFGAETGTVKYFHRLFPKGIHQAYLIAGLPMQDSCC